MPKSAVGLTYGNFVGRKLLTLLNIRYTNPYICHLTQRCVGRCRRPQACACACAWYVCIYVRMYVCMYCTLYHPHPQTNPHVYSLRKLRILRISDNECERAVSARNVERVFFCCFVQPRTHAQGTPGTRCKRRYYVAALGNAAQQ